MRASAPYSLSASTRRRMLLPQAAASAQYWARRRGSRSTHTWSRIQVNSSGGSSRPRATRVCGRPWMTAWLRERGSGFARKRQGPAAAAEGNGDLLTGRNSGGRSRSKK